MPFLRVVRDKRGYETTYLIHSFRDGPSPGSRVLYAFRSPGGVRVGRLPFEAEIRREIERGHPGLVFNWDELLSSQQVIDSTPDPRRVRRKTGGEAPMPQAPRRAEPQPQVPRLVVPTVVEGDTPETRMRFLAHWHGILCEQLPLRVPDLERRKLLMDVAQKLNPAGWLDADEIAAGVQGATEALERLSRLLSKRRRKNRRGGQRDTSSSTSQQSAMTDAESAESDLESDEHEAVPAEPAVEVPDEPERE